MMSTKDLKRYNKKDFLSYASGFDYQIDIDEGNITGFKSDDEIKQSMKKWKINEFRDFYGFTHKNNDSGYELDARNYKCLDCLTTLKPDYTSQKNNYYCADCL
jgi:formamidopyrimidine-DNA glycosylase